MNTPPPKNTRVAIYARAASVDQSDTAVQRPPAIVEQVALCRLFAEGHEWDVVAVYADASQSGLRKGKKLLQMMKDAAPRLFDVVLVRSVDRFGRNLVLVQHVLDDLGAVGVSVGVVSDPPLLCEDCSLPKTEEESGDA
jgi:DNA invertase Pin-like site-specific DNA recombinase